MGKNLRNLFLLTSLLLGATYLMQKQDDDVARTIKKHYEKGESGHFLFHKGHGYTSIPRPSSLKKRMTTPVTYGLCGRLGDSLLSYFHARWISYRDDVPFIRTPFPGDQDFALSLEEDPFIDLPIEVIPYFPEPSMKHNDLPFLVDWEDPGFRREIARCLAPTGEHQLLPLPPNKITVCVHVRRGGNWDDPSVHLALPLKFPPDSYYIEQIKTISKLFKGNPLYIFLMTDDLRPKELMKRYKEAIPSPNIQWDCREEPPKNHLNDFFSIPLFDCLILPDSNFSIVASKLTEYAIRISPVHYRKKKETIRITGLDIAFNPNYKK